MIDDPNFEPAEEVTPAKLAGLLGEAAKEAEAEMARAAERAERRRVHTEVAMRLYVGWAEEHDSELDDEPLAAKVWQCATTFVAEWEKRYGGGASDE